MKSKKLLFAGAALSGLMMAATAQAEDKKGHEHKKAVEVEGQCHGANACKGQSKCHSAKSQCAGANACKGQGWVSMTKDACDKKKGKWQKG